MRAIKVPPRLDYRFGCFDAVAKAVGIIWLPCQDCDPAEVIDALLLEILGDDIEVAVAMALGIQAIRELVDTSTRRILIGDVQLLGCCVVRLAELRQAMERERGEQ